MIFVSTSLIRLNYQLDIRPNARAVLEEAKKNLPPFTLQESFFAKEEQIEKDHLD